jgi:hypothetical protein
MGSNDPFVLAKVFYEDIIAKDFASVEKKILEELPFNWEEEHSEWKKLIVNLQQETKEYEGLYQAYKNLVSPVLSDRPKEKEFDDSGDIEVYPEGILESPYTEIPKYLSAIKDDLSDAEQAINDLDDQKEEVIKQVTGLTGKEWSKGRSEWTSEGVKTMPKEVYVRIHQLGLSFLEEKLENAENIFQTLKDNKEIPQVEPKLLARLRADMEKEIGALETRNVSSKAKRKVTTKYWNNIESATEVSSPEFRWKYHSERIRNLKMRIRQSEDRLKEYLESEESFTGLKEVRELAKEKGLEPTLDSNIFQKRVTRKQDGKTAYDEKGQPIVNITYYKFDSETKSFTLIPEEEVPETIEGVSEDLTFNHPEWYRMLHDSFGQINVKVGEPGRERKITKKQFLIALQTFFKKNRPEFDKRPIAGKTASGIGQWEGTESGGKIIHENPSVKLRNLNTLLSLFEQLPEEEKDKGAPLVIIASLKQEIGIEEENKLRGSKGEKSNFAQGKIIINKLKSLLNSAANKTLNYKEGKYPLKFLKDISEIKKTGLTSTHLRLFSEGKVTKKISDETKLSNKERYMLNTFSTKMVEPISKLLVKSNKNGKKLIELLLDAWDNEEVYQPRTGLSDEDFKVLSDLMDEHTSDLVKVIDRQEDIIRDEYEGMYQEEFEDILSEMKTNLQHLKNSKNAEMTDALITDLSALYHNMGDIVREVIQKVPRGSEERKQITDLYAIIDKEIQDIPEVAEKLLPESVEREWAKKGFGNLVPRWAVDPATNDQYISGYDTVYPESPHKILDNRRDIVEELQTAVTMKGTEGSSYSWVNDENLKAFINGRLPRATSSKGGRLRNKVIDKILKDKDISDKELMWDSEPKTKSRKYQPPTERPGSEEEGFDESDVQERELEELTEGGQRAKEEGEVTDDEEQDAFEQEFGRI